MKNSLIFLFALLFLLPFAGDAQEQSESTRRVSRRKKQRAFTYQQINQLHNGALLVRLKTKENTIRALRNSGKSQHADKLEGQQKAMNKTIVLAFREHFDFCPVYFFFSEESKKLKTKQSGQVMFLNDSLLPDASIRMNKPSFLTAEFGNIESDTSIYFGGQHKVPGENGLEDRKAYYGKSNLGFSALVIKSDELVQLSRPFPYYVRLYESLPMEVRPANAVIKMNRKLHEYYHKRRR